MPGPRPAPGSRARERFTPNAAQALRYAIARLAIDFVSGPACLARWLRTTLLRAPVQHPVAAAGHRVFRFDPGQHPPRRPVEGPGLRLAAVRAARRLVRRAPPVSTRSDRGKTSVSNCVLLCQFHHDVCIHRRGWQLILHPDGTTTAYGPDGQVLHSHSPPTLRAG